MHVIVFTPEISSKLGGQPLSTFEVSRYLSCKGHIVTLLYIKEGDLKPKYEEFCCQTIKVSGWDFIPKRIHKTLPSLVLSLLDVFKKTYKQSVNSRTIVYTDTHKCCLFLCFLAALLNCRSIFHIRQSVLSELPRKYSFAIRRINHFITVSHEVKEAWMTQESLNSINFERFSVVHNGVDLERFKPLDDENEKQSLKQEISKVNSNIKVISYIGRLDEYKGVSTLLKAFSSICRHTDGHIKLILAGESVMSKSAQHTESYSESLKQWVSKEGLDHLVDFVGYLENPLPLYQISDITVLPSLYPEPFGRAIIESMSCEVPVIASRIGGIPEILTHEFSQYLFEPGNSADLSEKLESLLYWRAQNPELGYRCRQHVTVNFPLHSTLKRVENILECHSSM